MNYLAHILLSGDNPEIIIGNFMADSIKGKQYKIYPEQVQIGVLLHRHIDTFTDNHHIVRQSTKRLHKKYSHYSGVIVDIFYDHFLAKNWDLYSAIPLDLFVQEVYQLFNNSFCYSYCFGNSRWTFLYFSIHILIKSDSHTSCSPIRSLAIDS